AATAVGISRKLAAFHLDKLVHVGLLLSRIEAVGEPKVGRTPRVYEPATRDVTVRVPPREPELLAAVLIEAVCSERADESSRDAVLRVAQAKGASAGRRHRDHLRPGRLGPERAMGVAVDLLAQQGFEPARDTVGVRLRNCPFHPLVAAAPGLVCGMNHAYQCGILQGLQADGALEAVLVPPDGACCVELRLRAPNRQPAKP
ncbi:MAG TPA: transcriptional regulator, partial [Mycobacteriales bacterium]